VGSVGNIAPLTKDNMKEALYTVKEFLALMFLGLAMWALIIILFV
jgi:hypothetical protein